MAVRYQAGTPISAESNRLSKIFHAQIVQRPEKIAENLRQLHPDHHGLARYVFANNLRPIFVVNVAETAAPFFHVACTTGLPKVLMAILFDARIYMWQESSEWYHPALEVSTFRGYH